MKEQSYRCIFGDDVTHDCYKYKFTFPLIRIKEMRLAP